MNYFELEQLAKNTDRFVKAILDVCARYGIAAATKALKASGVMLNPYGINRYAGTRDAAMAALEKMDSTYGDALDDLAREGSIFELLFGEFHRSLDEAGFSSVKPRRRLSAYLLMLEITMGSVQHLLMTNNYVSTKAVYPFLIAGTDGLRLVPPHKAAFELAKTIDSVASKVGVVVRFVESQSETPRLGETLSMTDVRVMRQLLTMSEEWAALMTYHGFWTYYDAKIFDDGPGTYRFDIVDQPAYESLFVSRLRFTNRLTKRIIESNTRIQDVGIDHGTKVLPPDGFRSKDEIGAAWSCVDCFASTRLDEKCMDVPLKAWIRSYTALREVGLAALKGRTSLRSIALKEWLVIKTEEEWQETLISAGVAAEHAPRVVTALTFEKRSYDLIDAPLMRFEGRLVALPSVLTSIEPARAMMSNFLSRGADVSFKGISFEQFIRSTVSKAGVRCSELVGQADGEQYQCDGAFVLDDELFLVEVKHSGQPDTFRQWYSFGSDIGDWARQLDRISDFFTKNLDLVRQALDLDAGWVPRTTHKVVVCAAMLGAPTAFGECSVIDESAFSRYWERRAPGISIGNQHIVPHEKDYEGPPTAESLMNVVRQPLQIRLQKKRLGWVDEVISVGSITLRARGYHTIAPDFRFLSAETADRIMNELRKIGSED